MRLQTLIDERRAGYISLPLDAIKSLSYKDIHVFYETYYVVDTYLVEDDGGSKFLVLYAYSSLFNSVDLYCVPRFYGTINFNNGRLFVAPDNEIPECVRKVIVSCITDIVIEKQVVISDSTQSAVRMFLEACNKGVRWLPGIDDIDYPLMKSLVREECDEFLSAMTYLESLARGDELYSSSLYEKIISTWSDVIDAMCDIIVVVHNTSNAMGIDLAPFMAEVLRSNLTKIGGPVREDGKILKPETYSPPDIRTMLEEYLEKYNITVGGQRNTL